MKMKFLFYLGLLGTGHLLSLNCYSGLYRYYDDCRIINPTYSQHCDQYNKDYGYQSQPYPYHYRNNPYYYENRGSKHNLLHISPSRFHNFGKPTKWKF
ncbi:hypothetical protein C4Q31_10935 [Leptospira borgpetersenii serovar Ceylonica]|nr:hypothetical protein C4Q31_10935 [Leptospira borgpetersenii serovar Ceylonica]PTM48627.1 hypothetical protein CLV95_107155 [Leptospira borgpetersenii serovar Javanica]